MESVIKKLANSKRVLVSGACLVFLLRLISLRFKRKRKYCNATNFDSIARKTGDGKQPLLSAGAPEYDVVIVGGGMPFALWRG